ncbi:MAG: HAMP domain-containing histidine kinase [Candidatus Gracilibacteria bacterium]|nr:HAMP domain-containing histidine kinase [Candidatus Gracilibacteria bacterium]
MIIISVLLIISVNIFSLFYFSNGLFESYLKSQNNTKREITLDYINSLIDKETTEYIDNLFVDVENSFFELLEKNKGNIPLNEENNVNIIVNYLLEKGVSPKYIQEIVPNDSFLTVWTNIRKSDTPEHNFIFSLLKNIIIANSVLIFLLILYLLYFTRKNLSPINEITDKIRKFKSAENFDEIAYDKPDEIGLLVSSINELSGNLKKQEQIRHKFLADISHELKTPITAIRCYLEGISDGVIKINNETLGQITEEMNRLVNLVNMIMDYERFENRTLKLKLKNTKVSDLVSNISSQYENSLKQNNQQINVEESNLKIKLDEEKFSQIVHNIISNFMKYAGKETTLYVKIRKNYLEFKDDGAGVEEGKIPFLTEKFYQADSSKTGKADDRGIGVGLSIVHKIIKSHKWKIYIHSGKDKGFSIKIFTQSSH